MDLLIEETLGIWMVALGVGGLRHRIHSTIVELDVYWNRSKNYGLQPTLLNTTMKASRKQDVLSSCQPQTTALPTQLRTRMVAGHNTLLKHVSKPHSLLS